MSRDRRGDGVQVVAGSNPAGDTIGAATDAATAAALVRPNITSDVEGVLIVGGNDFFPSQVLDCLPPSLRSQLPANDALSITPFSTPGR
jgi:hypothetical protein